MDWRFISSRSKCPFSSIHMHQFRPIFCFAFCFPSLFLCCCYSHLAACILMILAASSCIRFPSEAESFLIQRHLITLFSLPLYGIHYTHRVTILSLPPRLCPPNSREPSTEFTFLQKGFAARPTTSRVLAIQLPHPNPASPSHFPCVFRFVLDSRRRGSRAVVVVGGQNKFFESENSRMGDFP
jgi:hypothetical protein